MRQRPAKEDPKETLLETMRKRFRSAEEAEYDIRNLYDDDMAFRAGRQWPKEIEAARMAAGQPCLTINRLPQFERQILNEQRQNRPGIVVSPVDSGADLDTAKVFQGLIRHIEYDSNADVAYDRGMAGAVRGGFGYWRILTEYADDSSFNQRIKIRSIRDPKNVYLDPSAQEPDGSDARWGFIFEDQPKEEFEAEWPDAEVVSQWDALGATAPGWIQGQSIRVAEYFCIEHETTTLYLLGDHSISDTLPEGMKPIQKRTVTKPKVRWIKTNGVEILEETEWLGKWIPIIPVYGDELIVDGKRILEGAIRHAKDPMRMYNYWASCETGAIALAPKAPYVMAEGQDEGHEDEWNAANQDSVSYLTYKPVSLGGQQAPPPQRQSLEPAVGAITQARQLAADDLKATTGIYDAALGNRSNEQSGRAIRARQEQSQTANFHYLDNLRRAIRFCARQLVDLIPKVYDTDQVVRILGEDDAPSMVRINSAEPVKGPDGIARIYDLSVGTYDVIVSTGPSFQSRRQEAAEMMTELVRAYPQFLEVIGDLLVKNMDWPGAAEIAERLKRLLPDKLQDKQQGQAQIPPQVVQAVQQLQAKFQAAIQQNQQLQQALQQAVGKLNSKEMELASKERIAEMTLRVELLKQQAEVEGRAALATLQAELDQIAARMEALQPPPAMPTGGPAPGEGMGQPAPLEPGME